LQRELRQRPGIATIVFGMNLSLDGYVDHEEFAPGPRLRFAASERIDEEVIRLTYVPV
jgi:hypothetical protein